MTLEQRIEKLEHQNKTLVRILILFAITALPWSFMAFQHVRGLAQRPTHIRTLTADRVITSRISIRNDPTKNRLTAGDRIEISSGSIVVRSEENDSVVMIQKGGVTGMTRASTNEMVSGNGMFTISNDYLLLTSYLHGDKNPSGISLGIHPDKGPAVTLSHVDANGQSATNMITSDRE